MDPRPHLTEKSGFSALLASRTEKSIDLTAIKVGSQFKLDQDEFYSYCTLTKSLQNEMLPSPPGLKMIKCEHKLEKR
ncbi:hypothetical protein I4U23_005726 [Adineta vaga]|nr:hypothetical protein I4U23_005726 [Adineta vaga]